MTRGMLALLAAPSFAVMVALAGSPAHAEPVTLKSTDGTVIHGEMWRAKAARAPLIVAFHQADSSHDEYTPIAQRLNAAGYSVFAIDQRSGGEMYGGNKTAAAFAPDQDYETALPDLEAALAWARADAKGAKVLLWGSSYSSSLIFVLAEAHPDDVIALLSFSPGEYFEGKPAYIRDAAARLSLPVFIDQSNDAKEIAQSKAIFDKVKSRDKELFISKGKSVHGSSTLRTDKNASGAEEHWLAVMKFLHRVAPSGLPKSG